MQMIGKKPSKIVSFYDPHYRSLLRKTLRGVEYTNEKVAWAAFQAAILDPENKPYLEHALRYAFAAAYASECGTVAAEKVAVGSTGVTDLPKTTQEKTKVKSVAEIIKAMPPDPAIAKIVETVKTAEAIVLTLGTIMPDGRKLTLWSHEDLKGLAGTAGKLADHVPPGKTVGEVLTARSLAKALA